VPLREASFQQPLIALGYLFVAGMGEEQRQERETAGSFFFGKLRVRMTERKARAIGYGNPDFALTTSQV
jgi:hypothetical protein